MIYRHLSILALGFPSFVLLPRLFLGLQAEVGRVADAHHQEQRRRKYRHRDHLSYPVNEHDTQEKRPQNGLMTTLSITR